MTKFVCVYKRGPNFSPDYVFNLKSMVDRHSKGKLEFVCLTDHPEVLENDWAIALERPDKQGWWCLPEKFRITGPVIFSGLDTIIVDSLKPFMDLAKKVDKKTVYMIHCFRFPNRCNRLYANGMMVWNTDLTELYEQYQYKIAATQYPLEQDYTSAQLIERGFNIKVLQHDVSGIESFKRTCDKSTPPVGARVILFHGKPSVKEVARTQQWAKDNWK